eukprot:2201545-Amphidinium_carterae.1
MFATKTSPNPSFRRVHSVESLFSALEAGSDSSDDGNDALSGTTQSVSLVLGEDKPPAPTPGPSAWVEMTKGAFAEYLAQRG